MSLVSAVDRPTWEAWQLRRALPDTEINTSHFGINLGCIKCGALVLCDDEIVAIRHGSVWSKRDPQFVSLEPSSSSEKDDKKQSTSPVLDVKCEICGQVLGSYYPRLLQDHPLQIAFPAAKIMYLRQSSSRALFNKTALLGFKDDVEKSIDSLVPLHSPTIGNGWMTNK